MLNSFWGKFGENLLKPTTTAVHQAHHLFAVVSNPFNDIRQVRIVNDDTVEIVHANLEDNQPDNGRINIFVAAFTTCYARLKLYSYLDRLQQRVLYFDTDSVIYTTLPGQPNIPLGDYLGEMTDELDDGDFIVDLTSAGPKNYGYRTQCGKVCCKVRGFSLMSAAPDNSTMTSCDKTSSTKSPDLSTNDATSTSSTRTSSGETPPRNIFVS